LLRNAEMPHTYAVVVRLAAAKGALMQCCGCVVLAYEQQAPDLSDARAQSGIAHMMMFLTHRLHVNKLEAS
jgi:hypothetical protein